MAVTWGQTNMKKLAVELLDDDDRQSPAAETVRFGLDGVTYEIDLSARNAQELRRQLTTWMTAGRRVSGTERRRSTGSVGANTIRQWARRNGHPVGDRGRISQVVIDAYKAQLVDD